MFHGINVGHGYVKYIACSDEGVELPPVVFPAQIARAQKRVAGALTSVTSVHHGNTWWWAGEDAAYGDAITMLAQERLHDPMFIPVLLTSALSRFCAPVQGGYAVTGLPATWAQDPDKARALGARLRAATGLYHNIRVIAEPLGALYAQALDTQGRQTGDPELLMGRVGIVDIGHLTVDVVTIHRGVPVPSSLDTWQLGTSKPLRQIRAQLGAATGRELSMHEADQMVRAEHLTARGRAVQLPTHWDKPILQTADAILARLREAWRDAADLDVILVAGGGAESERLIAPLLRAYPHALVVDQPQTAIARGYARLARKLGGAV